jgi:hypothetical protein
MALPVNGKGRSGTGRNPLGWRYHRVQNFNQFHQDSDRSKIVVVGAVGYRAPSPRAARSALLPALLRML